MFQNPIFIPALSFPSPLKPPFPTRLSPFLLISTNHLPPYTKPKPSLTLKTKPQPKHPKPQQCKTPPQPPPAAPQKRAAVLRNACRISRQSGWRRRMMRNMMPMMRRSIDWNLGVCGSVAGGVWIYSTYNTHFIRNFERKEKKLTTKMGSS